MPSWTCPLVLNSSRQIIAGSQDALVRAIRRGADLRIYTEFRHNEHIDVRSPSDEKVREVAEFAVTYLVEDRWAAGLMSLRQPVSSARRIWAAALNVVFPLQSRRPPSPWPSPPRRAKDRARSRRGAAPHAKVPLARQP